MSTRLKIGGGRTVDLHEPRRNSFSDNLGGAFEYSLSHFVYKILEVMGEGMGAFLAGVLVTFMERVEPELVDYVSPLLDYVLAAEGMPPQLREFFEGIRHPEGQVGAALLSGLGSAAGGAAAGNIMNAALAPVAYWINRSTHIGRPGMAEYWALRWRDKLDPTTADDYPKDLGWRQDITDGFEDILRPRAGVPDLLAHAWRKFQNPEAVRGELQQRGFLDEDIDKFIELSEFIPGTADLISMAVREAWRDDVAARYGYDEDFPAEFAEWAAKRGMSSDWCKRYWRAHWQLPGPTMARDMLHRTDMTEEDYATLLRIADYPGTFREWMTEIAYAPYTRVDIRRMYKLGVLETIGEVIEAYKAIGYDDEKAGKLAEFTLIEYGESEREATKSDILTAYDLGRMSPEEAKSILTDLGYQTWIVDVYLARVDLKHTNKRAREVIRHTKTLYTNSQITRTDAVGKLAAIPLPGSEIERYLEGWEITREAKVGRPSRAELREFFLENVLSEMDFRRELVGHRMSQRYIDWYTDDAKLQLMDRTRKEQERALKEAERLRTAEIKTVKDVHLADLNVGIADANVAIADIKLHVTELMTVEEVTEALQDIKEYKRLIAVHRKTKAEVRRQYLREKTGE